MTLITINVADSMKYKEGGRVKEEVILLRQQTASPSQTAELTVHGSLLK